MNIATLIPTKSDAEIAAELRRRIPEAWAAVLALQDDAKEAGFNMAVQAGVGPFGKNIIMSIQLAKVY